MRQLILRLPDHFHRNLRLLAAANEKTMTDLVMEWIQREIEKLTRDPLLKALYADSGLPTRSFSKRQLDEFARADAATPKELQEWARKSLKKGKPK